MIGGEIFVEVTPRTGTAHHDPSQELGGFPPVAGAAVVFLPVPLHHVVHPSVFNRPRLIDAAHCLVCGNLHIL
jgi:hypothetical protein